MKLSGCSLSSSCLTPFSLRRGTGEPLALLLRPLSLGFHQRLREHGILPPWPPVKIARDSAGRPLRDGQGMAVTLADTRNTDYVKDLERYHQSVAVLSVVEALQADQNVTFETPQPTSNAGAEAWKQYASGIFDEMEQAGFTAGDLVLLCREVCRLSNLIETQLSAAQSTFSSDGENPSD